MDKIKLTVTAVISALMSWLGILAVPVFLMVGCNFVDYIIHNFCFIVLHVRSLRFVCLVPCYVYIISHICVKVNAKITFLCEKFY